MSERDGLFEGHDPFEIFERWFQEAAAAEPNDPNAMTLATVDADGLPDLRIVLLKGVEDGGLVFFTNYESRKGQQLIETGSAAVNFHWKSLARQVRFRGAVSKVTEAASDEYYQTRPLGSRIGAWASQQSQPLENKQVLIDRVSQFETEFGQSPPRPAHWGGFRLVPTEVEFWSAGEFRLHDRFRWSREQEGKTWKIQRLNP